MKRLFLLFLIQIVYCDPWDLVGKFIGKCSIEQPKKDVDIFYNSSSGKGFIRGGMYYDIFGQVNWDKFIYVWDSGRCSQDYTLVINNINIGTSNTYGYKFDKSNIFVMVGADSDTVLFMYDEKHYKLSTFEKVNLNFKMLSSVKEDLFFIVSINNNNTGYSIRIFNMTQINQHPNYLESNQIINAYTDVSLDVDCSIGYFELFKIEAKEDLIFIHSNNIIFGYNFYCNNLTKINTVIDSFFYSSIYYFKDINSIIFCPEFSSEILIMDANSFNIKNISSPPFLKTAKINNLLFLYGLFTSKPTDLFIFNTTSLEWKKIELNRYYVDMYAFYFRNSSKIYFISYDIGYEAEECSFSIITYDFISDKIFTKKNNELNLDNRCHPSISNSNENLILIAGGYSGSEKNINKNIETLGACEIGYCQTKLSECVKCPKGFYCPQFCIRPYSCPAGSYCPELSSFHIKCSPGTYTFGKYGGFIKQEDCIHCPAGTFSSNSGVSGEENCFPCSNGFYCPEGSQNAQPCYQHHYCPDTTKMIPCPEGTFYDGYYAVSIKQCKKCPFGYYCNGNGGPPVACFPGTYSDKLGGNFCEICPAGHYCPFATVKPIICEINFVASKGSGACTECKEGQFTEKTGQSACDSCVGDRFEISGWWCMSFYNRAVFILIWVGSFVSLLATSWNIYRTLKEKIEKLRESNMPLSFFNLIYTDKSIKEKKELENFIEKLNKKRLSQNKLINNYENFSKKRYKRNQHSKNNLIIPMPELLSKKIRR